MRQLRILLVENVHPVAQETLTKQGWHVESLPDSPNPKTLIEKSRGFDVLGIRSKTILTKEFFDECSHLLAVGAFCIGTNQIDLVAANRRGIPVFNAPYSNTRSVAELVLAEIIMLSRQLGDRNTKAHQGQWQKSADGSREIRGKTLGIVGYGHIGSQLSVLAEAVGMKVYYYDIVKKLPLGNAQALGSLEELLQKSEFVSLHVPETPQTQNMISSKEISVMKAGSYLLNASRGTIVVIEDLAQALKAQHLAGAAIDVFPVEPASNKEAFVSPLQNLSNVILTSHIGGSTQEAQVAIGHEVSQSFVSYLKIGATSGAVNFPNVDLPVHESHRILNVHQNEPGVLGEINSIVSAIGGNIKAQFLSTDPHIGYLVMDVENADARPIADQIGELKRSIKTRVVY